MSSVSYPEVQLNDVVQAYSSGFIKPSGHQYCQTLVAKKSHGAEIGAPPQKPKPKPSGSTGKSGNRRTRNAERSAYFASREAAKVLRAVLQGDAQLCAVGSIKSLVYSPSVKNNKATFALVCQTLKGTFTSPKGCVRVC